MVIYTGIIKPVLDLYYVRTAREFNIFCPKQNSFFQIDVRELSPKICATQFKCSNCAASDPAPHETIDQNSLHNILFLVTKKA